MPLLFSLYLDLIRFFAAVAVLFGHAFHEPFSDFGPLKVFSRHGGIAVTVFFVLSGYVIAYVVSKRENRAEIYSVSRISRIYSVLLPSLAITLVLDFVGQLISPATYTDPNVFHETPNIVGYLSTALFLNEYVNIPPNGIAAGSNAPLWSLSFEMTYYLLCGLVLFTRRSIWIPASIALLLLAGQTITAMLPIWAAGYFLFQYRDRLTIPRTAAIFAFFATLAFMALAPLLVGDKLHIPIEFPWSRKELQRDLLQDYAVVIAFSVNLISAYSITRTLTWSPRATAIGIIRWLGDLTFPLYCVHFPVLAFCTALISANGSMAAGLLSAIVLSFALAAILVPISNALRNLMRSFSGSTAKAVSLNKAR